MASCSEEGDSDGWLNRHTFPEEPKSMSNFWRTAFPLIVLAGLIISIWPTEPLDFGSNSPWDGLVVQIENSSELNSSSLLIASLPGVDQDGASASLIVGYCLPDGTDPLPILLNARTDALLANRFRFADELPEMYRQIRGQIHIFDLTDSVDPDRLLGGVLTVGDTFTRIVPSAVGKETPSTPLSLPTPIGTVSFEARCDENHQRWRSPRRDFRELWNRASADEESDLTPFIHGTATIGS